MRNIEWLKRTTNIGLKVVEGSESRRGFFEYFKVIEQNAELKKLLYSACKKVFDEVGEANSRAA